MKLNNFILNLIESQATKIIWENKTSKLELVSAIYDPSLHKIPSIVIETELLCDTDNPKQHLTNFLEAIQWLRNQEKVISINYDITGDLLQMLSNKKQTIHWNSMKTYISFQVEE